MFKITFKAQGTNILEAMQRLQSVGLKPINIGNVIQVQAYDCAPIQNLIEDLNITEWNVIPQD